MTEMKAKDFTANGTHRDGAAEDSLMLLLTNNIGGGTFNVKRYSAARDSFVTVRSFTAVTAEAQEVRIGKGETIEFELVGATTPNLSADYWFVK